MQGTWVRSLGQDDPLEKEVATHSSVLTWEIPWTGEPGRLQPLGLQRVGHHLVIKQQQILPIGSIYVIISHHLWEGIDKVSLSIILESKMEHTFRRKNSSASLQTRETCCGEAREQLSDIKAILGAAQEGPQGLDRWFSCASSY